MKRMLTSLSIFAALFLPRQTWAASQMTEISSLYYSAGLYESTQTVTYDGPKKREETSSHSRVLFFGHSKDAQVEIVRADLGKRWVLDPKHKRYTEDDLRKPEVKGTEPAKSEKEALSESKAKPEEPQIRIRKIETKVDGPGASITLAGFSCRPYQVVTMVYLESVKEHKDVGTQTYYEKFWNTQDTSAIDQFAKDETVFYKAESEAAFGKAELHHVMEQFKVMIAQNQAASKKPGQDPSQDWMRIFTEQAQAMQKVKGYPIRTYLTWLAVEAGKPQQAQPPKPAEESKDDRLVHAGDLSGGVGGLATGIASRWASKKIEKKVQEKMSAHPSWVDDIQAALGNQPVPFAQMTEKTQIGKTTSDPALFEVPPGYKKVTAL